MRCRSGPLLAVAPRSAILVVASSDTKLAWETFTTKEHRLIACVLKQKAKQAGVEIIPKEDYDEMVNADQKMMADQLKGLFGCK